MQKRKLIKNHNCKQFSSKNRIKNTGFYEIGKKNSLRSLKIDSKGFEPNGFSTSVILNGSLRFQTKIQIIALNKIAKILLLKYSNILIQLFEILSTDFEVLL